MRKDILDEPGLTEKAENMFSWSEFEEILAAVYETNRNGPLPEELQANACISNSDNSGELTAINNVVTQYRPIPGSGISSDLEKDYEAFPGELDSAGIQTVIDAYQEQPDAWLADK